jgi:hypothetical protein
MHTTRAHITNIPLMTYTSLCKIMSGTSLVFSDVLYVCLCICRGGFPQSIAIYVYHDIYLPDGCPVWLKHHEFTWMHGLNGDLTNNMWSSFEDYIMYFKWQTKCMHDNFWWLGYILPVSDKSNGMKIELSSSSWILCIVHISSRARYSVSSPFGNFS